MHDFTFMHAADLHLDSPLAGLRGKSATWAQRVEQASRQAFSNLIALTMAQGCQFMVLAGDVFDGELRNYQTGLFFLDGMRQLHAAGIEVFVILGNHDAENQFAGQLPLSQNVHLLARDRPESLPVAGLAATVHGQSFAQRDVVENLARNYPAPVPGHFNIGLLHTACQGSEGHHAAYAPCSLAQLVNHGYDYWALGHIHARQELSTYPHVLYPGNLQGRSPRETGAKGATLVRVADGRVAAASHHDLDVVRWAQVQVDLAQVQERAGVVPTLRAALAEPVAAAQHRALALRIRLSGRTPLHAPLQRGLAGLRDEVERLLAALADDLWLEKLELTTEPVAPPAVLDPSVSGRLAAEIRRLAADGSVQALVARRLQELRHKIPAAARPEPLFAELRDQAPSSAVDLALALIGDAEAEDALH